MLSSEMKCAEYPSCIVLIENFSGKARYTMECKRCKKSWNSSRRVECCPFCGVSLFKDNLDMSISDAIKAIVQERGTSILQSHNMVLSMVLDYVKGQVKEKKLFKIACQHKILDDAYEIVSMSDNQIKKECANKAKLKLEYDAFLSEENARMIINIILEGLDAGICLDTENVALSDQMIKNEHRQTISNSLYDRFTECPSTWTEKAKEAYILATTESVASAQFDIGSYYYKGEEGLAEDVEEAAGWYRKAAEQGYSKAQMSLGICYTLGHGVEQDSTMAAEWYRKAAMQGYVDAQFVMGLCCDRGVGVKEDSITAASWYLKAAMQGHADAQFIIGTYYHTGEHVEEDPAKAVDWYQKAAGQGHSDAQLYLGLCYEYGEGVIEDCEEAVKWYRKAAEQGNGDAQLNLAACYADGVGIAKDQVEAAKWYRKAAEQEYVEGQWELGLRYTFGNGVPEDAEKAVYWYQKAAEQGDAKSQWALSAQYLFGRGVEKDQAESVKWCRKAAEQGLAEAQLYLGDNYRDGVGVTTNKAEAIKWYRLAAKQGLKRACSELEKLGYSVDETVSIS